MSSIKICALQLGTLPLSDSRLDYYLDIAAKKGAKIVLLGEYVINSFFSELKTMPKSMIKEQSEQKRSAMTEFAAKYDLHIIAPIVLIKDNAPAKILAHFSPQSTKYKQANALMPYSHWNEAEFFKANKTSANKVDIAAFSLDGFKFGCAFGFETHFDEFWVAARAKKLDCMLVSTACALGSSPRWDALLSMRAFTNNIFVLRANRLGKTKFKEGKKEVETSFYGRSMLCSPDGIITNNLDEKEGMLLCELNKVELNEARKAWKFAQISAGFKE